VVLESRTVIPSSEKMGRELVGDFFNLPPTRLFFCLNLSSQVVLLSLDWLSLLPTVAAKNLAFSRIMESVREYLLDSFLAQLARARSMSGNLPLDFFAGDWLPSWGKRYFSFCRRTFETVLWRSQQEQGYLSTKNNLRSTPNFTTNCQP
jgi:hypothetical protein